MRHLSKLLAWLISANMLCVFTKADLPPGTLELIKNNEVEELDLSGQTLSPEDIKGLGELLKSNTAIKTLILAENYLDNSCCCCTEMSDIMCANSTLLKIDISGNFIGDRCIVDVIRGARTRGKFWLREKKNKFCLIRNTETEEVKQHYFPESFDKDFQRPKAYSSKKWEQKKKARERAQDRSEKELDQGKLYD